MGLTDKQRERIVKMYHDKVPVLTIVDKLQVSRATVYNVIRASGEQPSRQRRANSPARPEDYDDLLSWALARVEQLERENAEARAFRSAVAALLA